MEINEYDYDIVVIGAGPAGEGAAINAAKHGKRVAIIEDKLQVGGNCTHMGTIPSKALRQTVRQIIQFNTNTLFRSVGEPNWFTFPQILQESNRVIDKQVKIRTKYYARNRIDLHRGRAYFQDANRIEVKSPGGRSILCAEEVLIATGSRPYLPPDIDFNHPRIYNSDTVLGLNHTPRKIIIYGGGVIGCEYASIFLGLGSKVDLINPGSRLLSFLDNEISEALRYHLRDNGALVRQNEEYESVSGDEKSVVLTLKSGKKIKADAFLWCNGRTGNTDQLGLENVGLQPNSRGQLKVDEHYRTEVPHIFAAGDVIGWPSLASAAYDQGRSASAHIMQRDNARYVDDVPSGIYTIPEISSIGKTEAELTEAHIPYEVGQAFFKDIARAQITGDTVGLLKLLFHRETKEILGIHCFGAQASEIVHIGQAIMAQPGELNNIEYFVNTTFNYPTMAEAYRVAALNGLNRIF